MFPSFQWGSTSLFIPLYSYGCKMFALNLDLVRRHQTSVCLGEPERQGLQVYSDAPELEKLTIGTGGSLVAWMN